MNYATLIATGVFAVLLAAPATAQDNQEVTLDHRMAHAACKQHERNPAAHRQCTQAHHQKKVHPRQRALIDAAYAACHGRTERASFERCMDEYIHRRRR